MHRRQGVPKPQKRSTSKGEIAKAKLNGLHPVSLGATQEWLVGELSACSSISQSGNWKEWVSLQIVLEN